MHNSDSARNVIFSMRLPLSMNNYASESRLILCSLTPTCGRGVRARNRVARMASVGSEDAIKTIGFTYKNQVLSYIELPGLPHDHLTCLLFDLGASLQTLRQRQQQVTSSSMTGLVILGYSQHPQHRSSSYSPNS
jgi:hypothetical protein